MKKEDKRTKEYKNAVKLRSKAMNQGNKVHKAFHKMITSTEEDRFETLVNSTLDRVKELILTKGKEYRRNGKAFHNFREAGNRLHCTPIKALQGMVIKQQVSFDDIINDIEYDFHATDSIRIKLDEKGEKWVNEKVNDMIVYLLLAKGIIFEDYLPK